MKVLWFTNIPMPAVNLKLGRSTSGTGYWMSSLLDALKSIDDICLGVVTAYSRLPDVRFSEDGVEYFVIGQPRHLSGLSYRKKDLRRCLDIVQEWRPDLVHIHGVERFYGMLLTENLLDFPAVISFQGLVGEYLKYYFGSLSFSDIIRSHSFRELMRGSGLLLDYYRNCKAARRERSVMAFASNFIGRTQWDRAHLRAINPHARYYHMDELMRPEFRSKTWSLKKGNRYSIVFTNARTLIKDVETIIRAIKLLKSDFPSVRLRLAGEISSGSGYGRLLLKRIATLGLDDCVELLGYLDGEEMVEALCQSHVFCIGSYVENSPNSLCEAQLVGMPCVASYGGGIPSLVRDSESGLLFAPGDAALLAARLREIFENDELAIRISRGAREAAIKRHDPDTIVKDCLKVYRHILGEESFGRD